MNQFEQEIDWTNTEWNYMAIDFNTQTLRLFIVHKEDNPSEKPTRALCMDIDTGAWWTEKYPQQLTGGTQVTLADGSFTSVHGCTSGVAQIDKGPTDIARGCVLTVTVTDRGYGYRTPPTATVEGGNGARLQAALDQDGQVASIWIFNPGYGYTGGDVNLSAPDDDTIPIRDRRPAKATYTVSPLTEDLAIWTTYHVRTGNIEYPTDETDKNGGAEQRRDIKLTYQPAKDRNEVSVRMYYNDSDYPRHNVSERDRGTGFVDSTVDPASRLDLGYMLDEYGVDSGVARAIRTGKTIEDIRSNDRHVAVEICGPRHPRPRGLLHARRVWGRWKLSYQNQMAQLISELQKAGIPRKNAVAIGRILGNSLQEMRRGPETKDVTNPKMRSVDSTGRKQQFKNIDFLQGDPDYRKLKKELSENKPNPVQPGTVQSDKDPTQTDNYFNVESGPFVQVEPKAEGVEVGLRIVGTQPIMCQDAESGSIMESVFVVMLDNKQP